MGRSLCFLPLGQHWHTHLGTIGNPGNDHIATKIKRELSGFGFEQVEACLRKLVS
ncbi:MAG: hypothetical protein RIC35_01400 [Marinoscillum sp.]